MRKNVLLVEHNPTTTDLIMEILYNKIFDITVAGDAATARKLLSKYEYHLVITEALLPKSHGAVLAKYISEKYPQTKIFIISEKLNTMNYRSIALQHGASEYIEKPFDVLKFKKKVTEHLNIREKSDTADFDSETTNIHFVPLLKDLNPEKTKSKDEKSKKNSDTASFDKIIKDIEIKSDTNPFVIDLDQP